MQQDKDVLFLATAVDKFFGDIQVLKKVNLDIRCGEVHALMGENGAGKSTIIKIIMGVYPIDGGQLYMNGEPISVRSRQDARKHGISVIYQELSYIPALTVVENIFLGQEITDRCFLSRKKMREKVKSLIDSYHFDIDPDAVVGSLPMAKRQMVEILKALSANAKLIIMDEPTSCLPAAESEVLFDTIEKLRNQGASILYISHRLEEVYRLSDRLTVMRDGENVGVLGRADITPEKVMTLMIGKTVRETKTVEKTIRKDTCLEVKDLAYKSVLKNVNFKAYGGEILGIGGLVGSGRTELIKCIFGAEKQSRGTITLNGEPVSKSIPKNIKKGFGLVPEDRRNEGLVGLCSIGDNLALVNYDRASAAGVVKERQIRRIINDAIKNYDIRPPIRTLLTGNLSGGNQQKVVIGRWLARSPRVLLLDEPTAGIDIGVKAELYRIIEELSASGAIVIMVSSDLEELTTFSDRILVMHDGGFFEEFSHENVTQTSVLLAASGIHTEEGVPV